MNAAGLFFFFFFLSLPAEGCVKPKRARARPTGQSCDLQPPRRSAGISLHSPVTQAALDWTDGLKGGGTATRKGATIYWMRTRQGIEEPYV
ncbi:hypothetical protein LX36DRAFT_664883, partial [Colletotrichum falcatum]